MNKSVLSVSLDPNFVENNLHEIQKETPKGIGFSRKNFTEDDIRIEKNENGVETYIYDPYNALNKQITELDVKCILKKYGIDEQLIKIACSPFEKCLVTFKGISHARLKYINYYRKEMGLFFSKPVITTESTINFLLRVDFNSPEFVKYYIQRLISFADDSAGTNSKSEYYCLQLKSINQLWHFTGMSYEPTLPGIREQVANWLTEEITFLEKKQQLNNTITNVLRESLPNTNKVHTKLSVAHLSLAVKLLVDTGVIKNNNYH